MIIKNALVYTPDHTFVPGDLTIRDGRIAAGTPIRSLEAALGDDAQTAAALTPVQQALKRVESQVGTLERDRVDQFAVVREALTRVEEGTTLVGKEAASLASSLRISSVRGAWGEVQLRRVLEVSGLMARCDFEEQSKGVTPDSSGTGSPAGGSANGATSDPCGPAGCSAGRPNSQP